MARAIGRREKFRMEKCVERAVIRENCASRTDREKPHADGKPDIALATAAVVLGGAMLIALGLLKLGRFIRYTPYPVAVTDAFVDEAARTGVDIFRIFDALNNVESMRPAIDAVLATGSTVAEVAMSFASRVCTSL